MNDWAKRKKQLQHATATGDRDKAREHWVTAKEMIERMGYHRRDKDVAEIEAELG